MTDPTITIAGLEARIKCLVAALRTANTGRAEAATLDSAACGYNAQLRTERDALAAQLAEVRAKLDAAPKVCAIHSYEHGPGPCMTCGAWPPGTRELIASCRTRIAGLEQAANERSRTGQMSEPERSEWIGAAVAVADALGGSLGPVSGTSGTIDPREWIHFAAGLADRAKKLTARMAELEARPVLTEDALHGAIKEGFGDWRYNHGAQGWPGTIQIAVRALAALGRVTLPPVQDRAEELCRAFYASIPNSNFDQFPEAQRPIRVDAMRRALASLGAPPTSPPAARPVFAGVSEEELYRVYADAYGEPAGHVDDRRPIAIRAVLARIEVSLVAPVDPEAVARDYAKNAATGYAPGIDHPPYWFEYTDEQRTKRTAAMRATLIARGIPVTPEVGK